QFLLEAIILSNIGGAIGVVIGFGLGNIVSLLTHFAVTVPVEWAVIGVLFCTGIGVTFGFWPAFKAAKMDPIESLRYE
ncbi:MAG TPA: FtsX-like permease family protein, partial [Caldithrix sp.]|nr:FtsX-like permease family protein [Caldithrix sp.]